MLERLMPRTEGFFDDFDTQCSMTVEGARMLHGLLSDYRDVPTKVHAIQEMELQADRVAHAAFHRLHQQFITPFDRGHIHALLSRVDDVLDFTHAAAARLHYYEIEASLPEAIELSQLLVLCTEKVREVVGQLRRIQQPEPLLAGCKAIKRLETQADETLRSGMRRLFKSGMDYLTIIKWKEIFDLLETATDKCLDVADVVESVVLEHA